MFQHVTVLVSFIFAIALTHVFSSASQLLLVRDRVQLASGDKEEAIRLLEKSYEDHAPFDSADLGSILVDHRLDPLRSDPRFKKLVTRIFSGEPR